MKRLIALLALSFVCGCGDKPDDVVKTSQEALTLPPNGQSWYAEYSTTRFDCGILGQYVDNRQAAVSLYQLYTFGGPFILQFQRDPQVFNPWTGQWTQIGAWPNPGRLPTTNGHPPLCNVNMEAPSDAGSDAAGILRGGWAAQSNNTNLPCGVTLWGLQFGPLLLDELPGGVWANWVVLPQWYGWSFHAAGQVWTPSGTYSGCRFDVVSNLYQTINPVPP